jgi:hypothetical protein
MTRKGNSLTSAGHGRRTNMRKHERRPYLLCQPVQIGITPRLYPGTSTTGRESLWRGKTYRMNRLEHPRPLTLLCVRKQSLPHRIGPFALRITVRSLGIVFRRDVVRGGEEAHAESVGVEWPVADYSGERSERSELEHEGYLPKRSRESKTWLAIECNGRVRRWLSWIGSLPLYTSWAGVSGSQNRGKGTHESAHFDGI